MFTPEPIDSLSSEQVHEMFIWLDDLRDSGTVNMFGAYPLLAKTFSIERDVAKKVWSEWAKRFAARHGRAMSGAGPSDALGSRSIMR